MCPESVSRHFYIRAKMARREGTRIARVEENKMQAALADRRGSRSIAQTAREHNVSPKTLARWVFLGLRGLARAVHACFSSYFDTSLKIILPQGDMCPVFLRLSLCANCVHLTHTTNSRLKRKSTEEDPETNEWVRGRGKAPLLVAEDLAALDREFTDAAIGLRALTIP
jgi:hypothetical protein